jgi:hypothetical protein
MGVDMDGLGATDGRDSDRSELAILPDSGLPGRQRDLSPLRRAPVATKFFLTPVSILALS